MKNKDLIKFLERYPADMDVCVRDCEGSPIIVPICGGKQVDTTNATRRDRVLVLAFNYSTTYSEETNDTKETATR